MSEGQDTLLSRDTLEQKPKTSVLNILKFAGAFVAFMIGSGYATGQEIIQFFTAYGWWSIGGLVIALILFAFVGAVMMDFGQRNKDKGIATESAGFHYYCGRYFGMFLEWFIPVFLFMVVVVMVSGSGATIAQYTGLPHQVGTILMVVVVFLSNLLGLKRIVDIIGALAPLTIIITIAISIYTLINNPGGLAAFSANPDVVNNFPAAVENRNLWWLAGLLYVAYNATGSIPFFTATGELGNTRKEVRWGAYLGAALLVVAALMLNLAMLSVADQIVGAEVPVLVMAQVMHPIIGVIFTIVVLLEIFSTASPMMWISANRLADEGTKRHKIVLLILSIIALFGGFIPFGTLVGTVYPLTGYLGIVVIILIFIRLMTELYNKSKGLPIDTPLFKKD